MANDRVYRLIDLFAGAGGLTRGFERSEHFRSVFAVEFDEAAATTYATNFRHRLLALRDGDKPVDISADGLVLQGDIRRLGRLGLHAHAVIGGPPCQGFSPLGKMSSSEERRTKQGHMNELWQEYLRIVHQVRPLGFVIENVPQLLRSRELVAILMMAGRLGYTLSWGTLRAVDFGVPQRRVRGFIMGLLGGVTPRLPIPNHGEPVRTVRDEIGDLPLEPVTTELRPDLEPPLDLHIGRRPTAKSLARYRLVEPGENRFALAAKAPELTPRCWLEKPKGSTDVFGRLRWDQPAYTIRTEFFKPEKGCYLHPQADRPITHREAARLQTFDDNFLFRGSKTQIARQIGNAVPPRLAEAVARSLASGMAEAMSRLDEGWRIPEVDYERTLREVLEEAYRPEGFRLETPAAEGEEDSSAAD